MLTGKYIIFVLFCCCIQVGIPQSSFTPELCDLLQKYFPPGLRQALNFVTSNLDYLLYLLPAQIRDAFNSLLSILRPLLNAIFKWKDKNGDVDLGENIAHINSKHLTLLLQFNGQLASNSSHVTNQTFLNKFSKFIVSFNDEADICTMDDVLKLVSEYNNVQKNEVGLSGVPKKLEILISIPLTTNFSNVLPDVLERIKKSNLLPTKSVTALLLNYRSLHVTPELVPSIRNDARNAKRLMKEVQEIELTTGIILEKHNCEIFLESSPDYNFDLSGEDKLIFMSQLHSDRNKDVGFVAPHISCFFYGAFINAKISVGIPTKILIDLESSTYLFKIPAGDTLEMHGIVSAISKQIVFVFNAEIKENFEFEMFSRKKTIDESWLRQDTIFEKSHFGVSVYPLSQPQVFPIVMPKVFQNFRKIIVESQGKKVDYDTAQLSHLVRSMAQSQVMRVRDEISRGISTYGDIPVRLLIVANVNYEDADATTKSVKGAYNAALSANEEYPEIASVLLSLDASPADDAEFVKREEIALLDSKYATFNFFSRIWSLIDAFCVYTKENNQLEKHDYVPKAGLITEFCLELVLVDVVTAGWLEQTKVENTVSDLFILKFKVRLSDIIEYGAAQTASSVIDASRNCDVVTIYVNKKRRKYNLYVQLTGYNGTNNSSKDDIFDMIEVVTFWERLNSWAVKEKKTIFMDSAFEYPTMSSSQQAASGESSDRRGWWKVRNEESGNSSNGKNWTSHDGKSIALKMYEEMIGIKTQNESSYHQKAYQEADNGTILMAIFIPTSLFVIFIIAVSAFLIFRYRYKYLLSQEEVNNFVRGVPVKDGQITLNSAGLVKAGSQPYNKAKYEIARSSVKIDFTRHLGSGEFGSVVSGTIKRKRERVQVAVKMVKKQEFSGKSHGHYLALKGLISEIKILAFVGEHQHVVKMEGACTSKIRTGKLYVFLELCELGSLEKYLRAYNPPAVEAEEGIEMTSLTVSPELSADLRRWSIEIASGMEYLTSKKIVHGDLAARNILLDSSKYAKISDFGLSRRLYDYSEYLKEEAGLLPWKWMAPESLQRMIFYEKTDVWAFGVTLWEMYNLGDEPYPGLSWNVNFPLLLERGLRLSEPRYNPDGVYLLMERCWEAAPGCRPTFSELGAILLDNA